MKIEILTVDDVDAGQRLDRFLKKACPRVPFVRLQKLLRTGQIRVDGKRAKGDRRLEAGQSIRIPLLDDETANLAQEGELTTRDRAYAQTLLLFEDKDFIALNKPSGLATQGGSGVIRHVDGLLAAFSLNPRKKPKLVHRLDRETSGLLLAARTASVAAMLGKMFAERDLRKVYLAITCPAPKEQSGRIEVALKKGQSGPAMEKMLVAKDGQSARTDYQVLSRTPKAALVAFYPRTGRTHQIRVHAAHMGAPLLGDIKYGGPKAARLCLHAALLAFDHPRTGAPVVLMAPVPDDFAVLAEAHDLPLPEAAQLSKLFIRGTKAS